MSSERVRRGAGPDYRVSFRNACASGEASLAALSPRVLHLSSKSRPLLLFTDGAVESNKVTVGAFMSDPRDGAMEFSSASVNSTYVSGWKLPGQRQVISQAELLPVVVSKGIWAKRFQGCRVICFVDNNGARAGAHRGHNEPPCLRRIGTPGKAIKICFWDSATWYERVPSVGNPGRCRFKVGVLNGWSHGAR